MDYGVGLRGGMRPEYGGPVSKIVNLYMQEGLKGWSVKPELHKESGNGDVYR